MGPVNVESTAFGNLLRRDRKAIAFDAMAMPVTLRYAFARLRPLANPWVLAPTCLALMTMIFLWEYAQNPARFGVYRSAANASQADLTGLSPLEQALLADIDNISSLQESIPEAGSSPAGSPATADLSLLQRLLEEDPEAEQADTERTVSQYLDGYSFLRGANRNSTPALGSGAVFSRNPRAVTPPAMARSLLVPPRSGEETALSPLALVMQQQAAQAGARGQNLEAGATGDRPLTPGGQGFSGQSFGNGSGFGSSGLGNSGQPFQASPLLLPAAPQMSPPPGTTGYRAPTTALPPVPTPATPLNLAPSAGTNPISPVTPTFPAGGAVVTPQPVIPPPAAVTTPPPGGFIGDGYINTFSNPAGAP